MFMREFLYLIIDLFTSFSAFFRKFMVLFGLSLTDKQLHFLIIGVLCMIIYFLVHSSFKRIAEFSVSILSFIYTLTVGVVITFAIEIGQWKSGTGQMDFSDIVFGIYGFIVFFVASQLARLLIRSIIKKFKLRKQSIR